MKISNHGGARLLKMPGKKSFWGGNENFGFCLWEELTLDDNMIMVGERLDKFFAP